MLNVNTQGVVPFICDSWEGEPLFIIKGGICGSLFPDVYGEVYTYENFPWPEGKKVSKEECIQMAKENNVRMPHLWVTDKVYNQFLAILEKQKQP
jgi:hypothetical protein